MLRLFKKLFKPKPKSKATLPQIISEPVVKKRVFVSERRDIPVSPTNTKYLQHKGGKLDGVVKSLVIRINKLHARQKKYGLSKTEATLLSEYQTRLESVAATREGTKRIYIKD